MNPQVRRKQRRKVISHRLQSQSRKLKPAERMKLNKRMKPKK